MHYWKKKKKKEQRKYNFITLIHLTKKKKIYILFLFLSLIRFSPSSWKKKYCKRHSIGKYNQWTTKRKKTILTAKIQMPQTATIEISKKKGRKRNHTKLRISTNANSEKTYNAWKSISTWKIHKSNKKKKKTNVFE